MTTVPKKNASSKSKRTYLFGLHVSDIQSLLRFLFGRLADGELALVASSLTFTTVLALVPMLTVALAIFTAFPLFSSFREALQDYFIQNLMPPAMSANILGYLNQFASKATRLSAVGAVMLLVTSIATLATIEQIFNRIWHVKQKRPLFKRVMVYWALITLGPLLIGISLSVTSYLFTATTDAVGGMPGSKTLYTLGSVGFISFAFGLLYLAVPNRRIDWRDAAWGGLVAGILFEIAKRTFAAFVINIPTYTLVYGAVALIPIFLIWIYTSWLITLFGAVIAASLPVIKYERWWYAEKPGSRFIDAMAVLEVLLNARKHTNHAGVSSWEIRKKTRLGFDEIEDLLMQMVSTDWVGRLDSGEIKSKERYPLRGKESWVMLINPALIPISQVYRLFLFEPHTETRLSKKVETAIEEGLQESLETYFNS